MSIQDLEKARRLKGISLEKILEELGVTRIVYTNWVKGVTACPQEKVFALMEYLGIRDMDLGAQELAILDGVLKAKGVPRTAYYKRFGKDVTYILNQIRFNRAVSFDQVVRYYGGIGYRFVLLDEMNIPVRRITCSEITEFEDSREVQKKKP
jgi:transcriptional regulator with XRE-family HTH domain